MITALLLTGIAAALYCKSRSSKSVGRIPKPRRNIYAEIEYLQKQGVVFSGAYYPEYKFALQSAIYKFGWKPTASILNSEISKEEGYFKQLRRAYKALSPVGSMPHTTSVIRNDEGEVILTYDQYDQGTDYKEAFRFFEDELMHTADDRNKGYYAAVHYIATGGKFLWKGTKSKDGNWLTRGIEDEFAKGEGERKAYRKICASAEKGGVSIDKFAEGVAFEDYTSDYNRDDSIVKAGVLEAIADFTTPEGAQQYILNMYYDMYQAEHDGQERDENYDPERYSEEEEAEWESVKEEDFKVNHGFSLF